MRVQAPPPQQIMTKFTYNGRIYNPVNLEKKLKKMGITRNDIEIIPDKEEVIEMNDVKLYYFKNKVNGHTITSIYDNLDSLRKYVDVDNYYLIDEQKN